MLKISRISEPLEFRNACFFEWFPRHILVFQIPSPSPPPQGEKAGGIQELLESRNACLLSDACLLSGFHDTFWCFEICVLVFRDFLPPHPQSPRGGGGGWGGPGGEGRAIQNRRNPELRDREGQLDFEDGSRGRFWKRRSPAHLLSVCVCVCLHLCVCSPADLPTCVLYVYVHLYIQNTLQHPLQHNYVGKGAALLTCRERVYVCVRVCLCVCVCACVCHLPSVATTCLPKRR